MTVLLETVDNGVATLTMNRPEARNAMSGDMIAALLEALPRLGADNSVRCVVLTGAGGAFCAGGAAAAPLARACGVREFALNDHHGLASPFRKRFSGF